jgi:hypothetical protein
LLLYYFSFTKQIQTLFNNSTKINSIILHFKENNKNELFFVWCSGISLVEYENREKSYSNFKSSFFKSDLGKDFLYDYSKHVYNKDEDMRMKKCPNCGKTCKMDRFINVPISYIIKYNNYLRIQNTYKQLKMEREDIISFVKPLFVLEHNEIDINFKKKEFTRLKIGVKSTIT